eukprot:TRINITY_DN7179_c0_g1_i2.p1 TRINITY_DN7179_c0_g1~~TRINITY_DN7179_c0_g1_i2.p1  ORF type:complete len:528 (+),score=169.91 TRINITY_DN7179_c0_g1_i2:79-1584(+)
MSGAHADPFGGGDIFAQQKPKPAAVPASGGGPGTQVVDPFAAASSAPPPAAAASEGSRTPTPPPQPERRGSAAAAERQPSRGAASGKQKPGSGLPPPLAAVRKSWLEDDRLTEEPDLRFKVCDARMELPSSMLNLAYWVYEVHTVSRLDWPKKEMKAAHRYSDFLWLREELVHDHSGVIVPPLPEKDSAGQLEKVVLNDLTLINYRRRGLVKFLTAVGRHELLRRHPLLRQFCMLSGPEFEEAQKARAKERAQTDPGLGAIMANRSRQGWVRLKAAVTRSSAQDLPTGPEAERLEQRKLYAKGMEEALTAARDRLRVVTARRADTARTLRELGACLQIVGEFEKKSDPSLAGDLRQVGAHADKLGDLQREHADQEATLICEALGFFAGQYASIRATATRLQRHQLDAHTCDRDLAALNDPKKAHNPQHQAHVEEAEKHAKTVRDKFAGGLERFDLEWQRFHQQKKRELKHLQRVYVEVNSSYLRSAESTQPPVIEEPCFAE